MGPTAPPSPTRVGEGGGLIWSGGGASRWVGIPHPKVVFPSHREARSQHMSLLAERTELEIFLRQTVDDVRKEITRNSKISRARPASQAVCPHQSPCQTRTVTFTSAPSLALATSQ